MTRYFEINYTDYIDEDYTDNIIYNRCNNMDVFIENITDLYNKANNTDLTEEQMFTQYIKTKNITKEQLNDIKEYLTDFQDIDEEITLDNIYNNCYDYSYVEDILEIIANNNYDIREDLAEFYNINYGTVGYSDWNYYWDITDNIELVRDLWEGWNFYDIAEVNENLEYLDSIGQCYITSEKEIVEYLGDYFGVEEKDIVLIDNGAVDYFKLPKARVEVTYKIGEIIEQ